MRVTFHTDRIKSVLLFVHRLTATERASIDLVIAGDAGATVHLTLVRTTVEDLKRFMRSVPEGEAMAESVQEVTEQLSTELDDTQIGHKAALDDTRTGYRITLHEDSPRPLLYDGAAGVADAHLGGTEDPVDPKMKADAMPTMMPPMSTAPDFKPGDHGWFWGKRWKVTAVRPDARCAYVVDLEREEIPAGRAVLMLGSKVFGNEFEVSRRSMTASLQRVQVEEWMRIHGDVMEFSSGGAGYRVKLGSTEVTVPMAIADGGVESVRSFLQEAVPAAMRSKADAMDMAAAALREAARDIRIPPGA